MTLPTWAVVTAAAVLGAVFGSFANVAIHRWPRQLSVVSPPSACPACGTPIRPIDNIPVASWLILRGRCRSCAAPISARYPLVEIAVATLWALVALVHGPVWHLPALLVLAWALVVASAIDIEYRIIPNRLTYRLAPVLLVLLASAAALDQRWGSLVRALIAGVALPLGLFALAEGFRLVRGKRGMGMGDVRLAVSLGLVLGYLGGWEIVIGLYAAIGSAVVVVAGLMLTGRATLASRIPFGPYLAVGTLTAVVAGAPLERVVTRWLGL